MAYRTGIQAQIGWAEETTWGTYATASRFNEFLSETLTHSINRVESHGIRAGSAFLRTDRWAAGEQSVAGDVNLEIANKNFGLFFKHMLGGVATTPDGAGYKHTFTPGALAGLGLSLEVGRPDVTDGTVHSFQYSGLKVASWEMSNSPDNFLSLKLTLDGRAEVAGGSLASASFPATQELFVFTEGLIEVGGSSLAVDTWTLSGNNSLKSDRFKVGSAQKLEQLTNNFRDVSGTVTSDFYDLTAYNRFVNGTLATITLTYTTVTTYDTAKPYKLVVTLQNCRFDGDTPQVGGMDLVSQTLPFKVLYDGTNPVVQIDYYTSDAAP